MEYKRSGNSGMKVSRIILGCMGFGDPSRGTKASPRRMSIKDLQAYLKNRNH